MSEVTIREAGETDLADVLRAYTEAGVDGGCSFTPEEAREYLVRLRQYPSYRIFAAYCGGDFAGTYILIVLDLPAKRGVMMEHAREQCRLAGCYKMALSSGKGREDAHRFYESLGFERHGYSFLIPL